MDCREGVENEDAHWTTPYRMSGSTYSTGKGARDLPTSPDAKAHLHEASRALFRCASCFDLHSANKPNKPTHAANILPSPSRPYLYNHVPSNPQHHQAELRRTLRSQNRVRSATITRFSQPASPHQTTATSLPNKTSLYCVRSAHFRWQIYLSLCDLIALAYMSPQLPPKPPRSPL